MIDNTAHDNKTSLPIPYFYFQTWRRVMSLFWKAAFCFNAAPWGQ